MLGRLWDCFWHLPRATAIIAASRWEMRRPEVTARRRRGVRGENKSDEVGHADSGKQPREHLSFKLQLEAKTESVKIPRWLETVELSVRSLSFWAAQASDPLGESIDLSDNSLQFVDNWRAIWVAITGFPALCTNMHTGVSRRL